MRIMKSVAIIAILLAAFTKEAVQVVVSNQHGCKFWSSLAYNLTHIHEQVGDIMHMVCENDNNTDGGGCQEMKCGGKFQQFLPIVQKELVNFNFCFGFRLNHCDSPVSMSYFFNVPERNVKLHGKLTHDDSHEIPGGNYQGVNTTVIVTIRMEKKDDMHLVFGIQGEVRAQLLGSPIFDPKINVFPPTIIDILPCNTSDKKTDPPFVPLEQCGLPANYSKYPTWTTAAPKLTHIKSNTFNKSCEVGASLCDRNEVCLRTGSVMSRSGVCMCLPSAIMSPKTGYCELVLNPTSTPVVSPASKMGSTKGAAPSVTEASKPATKGGMSISPASQKGSIKGAVPSVTEASKSATKGGISTVAIVIAAVAGGLLLVVVIVSVIIYIGRRKRAAIYRDRHQLLTTDDDDDVNLVI